MRVECVIDAPAPKTIFDAQVAFNIQGRLGGEAKQSLESVEKRVLMHYRRLKQT